MIKNLSIKNFKGIENLELTGLKNITLISGVNSVGKTTILESIMLLNNYVVASQLAPILANRGVGVSGTGLSFEQAISGLFYNFDTKLDIKIT